MVDLLSERGQEADTKDGVSQGHCGESGALLAEHHRAGDQGAAATQIITSIKPCTMKNLHILQNKKPSCRCDSRPYCLTSDYLLISDCY